VRSSVPRAVAAVVALATLPWLAASQAGDPRTSESSFEPLSQLSIRSLTTPLVVTPDRPKVRPDGKRLEASASLFETPQTQAGVGASGWFAVDHRAWVGPLGVLASPGAERGPPLLVP